MLVLRRRILAVIGGLVVRRALKAGLLGVVFVGSAGPSFSREGAQRLGGARGAARHPQLCGVSSNEVIAGGKLRIVIVGENLESTNRISFQVSGITAKIIRTGRNSVTADVAVEGQVEVERADFRVWTANGTADSECYELSLRVRKTGVSACAPGEEGCGVVPTPCGEMESPNGIPPTPCGEMEVPQGLPPTPCGVMEMPYAVPPTPCGAMERPRGAQALILSKSEPGASRPTDEWMSAFLGIGGRLL